MIKVVLNKIMRKPIGIDMNTIQVLD